MSSLHKLMSDGRIRTPNVYAAPTLQFDLSAEIARLHAEEPWQAGHTAKTIAKYPDFRLVLVAMKAGAQLLEHKTYGRVSIQALSGRIQLHLPSGVVELAAGGLLTLDREMNHDVQALEDSTFLLTIAWPETEHQPASTLHPDLWRYATQRAAVSRQWQRVGARTSILRMDSPKATREQGLDRTLAETFPCSDSLSSIPDPAIRDR